MFCYFILDSYKNLTLESRSSEEVPHISSQNDKKIVGIRTDITFEITDDAKNSTGVIKKNIDAESVDEDDIIPVFKGYGNVHEPKSYGDNHRWDMINIPVFHGTDDEANRHGGGDWVRFVPITSVWTTERNNYLSNRGGTLMIFKTFMYFCYECRLIDSQRRFKTDINPHVSQKSWKPCLCNNDQVGFKSNTNNHARRSFVPTTRKVQIDDKLDRTFRDEDKSK